MLGEEKVRASNGFGGPGWPADPEVKGARVGRLKITSAESEHVLCHARDSLVPFS